MVFSRLIECACNFVMLRMKMLNTYVLHCNNSVPNSHCAPNHPYLESQGLNCEGHSSDRIGRMHMKGAQAAVKSANVIIFHVVVCFAKGSTDLL